MRIIHPPTAHLTNNEKTAIKAIRQAGLNSGKVGRTNYFMRLEGLNTWIVTISKAYRGLELRMEQRTFRS